LFSIPPRVLYNSLKEFVAEKELILEHSPNAEDPTKILQEVIRNLMLRKIDLLWQEHLLSIDHLRADVHLRVVGQKDPLIEFKLEAFHLFNEFSIKVRQSIARDLFCFEMVRSKPDPVKEVFSKLQMHKEKIALNAIIFGSNYIYYILYLKKPNLKMAKK